jgi:hypothetical protein
LFLFRFDASTDINQLTQVTMTQKEILVQRLSALLGFEDGASDVLEHLLSIESSDVS